MARLRTTLTDIGVRQWHRVASKRNHLCSILDMKIVKSGLAQRLNKQRVVSANFGTNVIMLLTPVAAAYALVIGRDSLKALNVDLDNLRAVADIVANGGKEPERQKSANPAIIQYS